MHADRWRARFDAGTDLTIGLEEELMLLHPETLAPLPEAPRAVAELAAPDRRYRTELPASQLELVTPPSDTLSGALESVAAGRAELAARLSDWARLAGAGAHPDCEPAGALVESERYRPIIEEYGPIVRYEQVYGLHVHVGVRGAGRVLAIFNALRGFLPEIAALAGNGPFIAGRDSGLASVRPKLAELLPRQGVPPVVESFAQLEALIAWGAVGGAVPDATHLWWEARMHPDFPTIEVRVADQPATVRDTGAVAAFVIGLIAWLIERHDAGEALPAPDTVRIAENRWRALRHGLRGTLLDLETGVPTGTRDRLRTRFDEIAGAAERAGVATQLGWARDLVECNGTERQRAIAAEQGVPAVIGHIAGAFLETP
jgi:carboxylate-amine ligase